MVDRSFDSFWRLATNLKICGKFTKRQCARIIVFFGTCEKEKEKKQFFFFVPRPSLLKGLWYGTSGTLPSKQEVSARLAEMLYAQAMESNPQTASL